MLVNDSGVVIIIQFKYVVCKNVELASLQRYICDMYHMLCGAPAHRQTSCIDSDRNCQI